MDKKKPRKTRTRNHLRGCNCKRSGCIKKYCDCFNEQVACTIKCRCEGCRNSAEHRAQAKVSNALPKHNVVEDGGDSTGSFQFRAFNENSNSSNVSIPLEMPTTLLTSMQGDDLFSEEYANQGSNTTNREVPVDGTLIVTQRPLYVRQRSTEANDDNPRNTIITPNVMDCVIRCLLTRAAESLSNNMSDEEVNTAVIDEMGYCLREIIYKWKECFEEGVFDTE